MKYSILPLNNNVSARTNGIYIFIIFLKKVEMLILVLDIEENR